MKNKENMQKRLWRLLVMVIELLLSDKQGKLDHVMKHRVENACFILMIRNNAKNEQENGLNPSMLNVQ